MWSKNIRQAGWEQENRGDKDREMRWIDDCLAKRSGVQI